MACQESDLESKRKEAEYKEVNLSLRHFGNMRFLIATLFFGFNGAMFYGIDRLQNVPNAYIFAAFFITVLAFVFCIFEWLLNQYIEEFSSHAKAVWSGSYLEKRPGAIKYPHLVTSCFIFLYFYFAAAWWVLACLLRK
jgi:hypothetical protein